LDNPNCVVAIYTNDEQAEEAVEENRESDLDMKRLPFAGRDCFAACYKRTARPDPTPQV
jgi:hypothetical protein